MRDEEGGKENGWKGGEWMKIVMEKCEIMEKGKVRRIWKEG